ncbi:fucose-specific lectin [Pluteus cervinus]|uniref:Fucose-specific lectin n=1 Tax=Pluteus cervinus TaxID=181527 RepID=A0ACD2ZYC9_9AGAR|nr:fucose-specific lectin [Pluteus cervinus]
MGYDQPRENEDAKGVAPQVVYYINYGTQNVANGGVLNSDNRDYRGSVYPQFPLLPPYVLPNAYPPPLGFPSPTPSPHIDMNAVSGSNPSNAESGTGSNQQTNQNDPRTAHGHGHPYRPLASIQFQDDSGKHIRVYSQDLNLNLVERFYDNASASAEWTERPTTHIIGRARLSTGLAATCWNSGAEIRVYYIDDHGTLIERAYSGGATGDWYNGKMTGRFLPAPYSKLAAFSFSHRQEQQVNVFYQDIDNKIQEVLFRNGKWGIGSPLPMAMPGTSIAAAGCHGRDRTWVYVQMEDLSIKEIRYADGDWRVGTFISTRSYPPGAPLTLVVLRNSEFWIFAIDETNSVHAIRWDGNRSKTIEITPAGSSLPCSALSVVTVTSGEFSNNSVRLYFQSVETDITELGEYNRNVWHIGNQTPQERTHGSHRDIVQPMPYAFVTFVLDT